MPSAERGKYATPGKRIIHQPKEKPGERPMSCEICGQKLERDPESGEYYCPGCYYSEDK